MSEEIAMLEGAYASTGRMKDSQGLPYIERSSLRRYMREDLKWKDSQIKNAFRQEDSRLMRRLELAGIIKETENGWSVTDGEIASIMLLSKIV